jgi:hypothetical protein
MNLLEGISNLWEELNRTFYSDRESFQDKHKNFTQIAKEIDLESPHITYDPFSLYSNSYALGGNSAQSTVNNNDMIRKWREASMLPEVDEALSEITSEAIVFDELDEAISLNLDEIELTENIKSKIRESFDKILYLLDFNEKGEELFKQWYIDSSLSFECVYNNRKMKEGLQKLILLPPFDIMKFKNEQDSSIRWYINKNQTYNPLKDLENAEITYYDEQITQITSGILSPDKRLFYSPIQKAMKAINQLYLLEDCLIIYRITKSPEKRAFYVDTGNLPKQKAEEYMKGLINKYRQKKVYNTESGTLDNSSKSISVLEDFWFATNANAKGTKVETLQGTSTNFTAFDDVDYFLNKVYTALNVPNTRRSKESRVTINPAIDIEKDEMKFFKYIQKLRRRFNNLFVDLLKKDLISRQVLSLDDWKKIQEKIKFVYASSNEISMMKKLQTTDVKVNSANNAMGLIDAGILSPEYIQKNILRLSDEEIAEIAEQRAANGGGTQPDALGNEPTGGGDPSMGGGDQVPGYTEVGGAAQPNMQPTPAPAGQTPAAPEETPKPTNRFKQKAREAGLPKEILESLVEGDIITNGKDKLLFENGKLKKLPK